MSGVLCEACKGYFQTSEHACGAMLAKEVDKLQHELMAMSVHPDYERGTRDGEDIAMHHAKKLDDKNNSQFADAVRASPLYQTKVQILRQVAEYLEHAGFVSGETFDAEQVSAFFHEFCILQKRCEIFSKDYEGD
jgi:hypothetical protein